MAQKIYTVYVLNRYLKAQFDQDEQLQNLMIEGEISNYRPHPSGHMYFTLKDERASISVVIFASHARRIRFKVENGLKVIIRGHVSVYEKTGNYQLYGEDMKLAGQGDLFYQFEMLKQKLTKEGLFDARHKKPIPAFPMSIAVLSAKQGAALQDTLKTIRQRYPVARIVIFPIPVQGQGAHLHIIRQLQLVDQWHFSTILLVRGGGSIEDLWNFNEEDLVRAIYHLNTPLISGIGHETDFTLVDFVADLRGATPTAAAMLATPDIHELHASLSARLNQLNHLMTMRLELAKTSLTNRTNAYILKNPMRLYENEMMRLDALKDRLQHHGQQFTLTHAQDIYNKRQTLHFYMKQKLATSEHDFQRKIEKLELVSPLKILTKGYTMVERDHHIIDSATKLHQDDEVSLIFADGRKTAIIK